MTTTVSARLPPQTQDETSLGGWSNVLYFPFNSFDCVACSKIALFKRNILLHSTGGSSLHLSTSRWIMCRCCILDTLGENYLPNFTTSSHNLEYSDRDFDRMRLLTVLLGSSLPVFNTYGACHVKIPRVSKVTLKKVAHRKLKKTRGE